MPRYQDSNGKDRVVPPIGCGEVERVLSDLGYDLFEVVTMVEISSKPMEFLKVAYTIQNPDESFSDWFNAHIGDPDKGTNTTTDKATDATLDALESFYPERFREILRRERLKGSRIEELSLAVANETLGERSTNLPELLESTLTDFQ